jgi:UDP-3-O-[3-hydroxymyristoyl] glucosamine N-acyltransferase
MKFPKPISIKEIAAEIDARIIGDDTLIASGINEIHKVEAGDITFSDVKKYFKKSLESAATIIMLNEETDCPEGKAILICDEPFAKYDYLVRKFRPFEPLNKHQSESAQIGEDTIIEPGVVIGNHVKIGSNCYIQANAYIGDYTEIGDHVQIQVGAIIGTDAFYFKKYADRFEQWRSGGHVVIEDHVSIGAGCTINKGVSGITRIGKNSILDCQVHIGHGAVIGERCLLAAQVGIGGKTIVGNDVVMYGQVGVAQNIKIVDGVVLSAQSGVSKSLTEKDIYFGSPADTMKRMHRQLAWLRMHALKNK